MLRILIGPLMVLACAAAHAQKMEPGQWEFTNTITLPKAPKPQTISTKRCITKQDVTDPAHFQGKPESDCKVTPKGKTGDSYAWEMSCPKSGMKGSGTTRYGKDTVEGETKVSGSSKGQPFEMTTKMKGRRVGPCK
jgi:uncharacterized protein DUF3617